MFLDIGGEQWGRWRPEVTETMAGGRKGCLWGRRVLRSRVPRLQAAICQGPGEVVAGAAMLGIPETLPLASCDGKAQETEKKD